jgi:hypothetical protein
MRICGYRIRDHVRLLAPLFGFIAAVWLIRLVLGILGVGFVRMFSVTGADALAILLAAVLIHTHRFGSYPNVVAASVLLVVWGQLLIVLAIVFAVLTGTNNIFTAPQYSFPRDDPHHLKHILGQLTYGVGAGILFGAAMGCFLLWILRMLVPPGSGAVVGGQWPAASKRRD